MPAIHLLLLLLIIIISPGIAHARRIYKEREYQERWCDNAEGITEYVLSDKTRVDCLTKKYAIEFEFADNWAESIGQAMYYSIMTDRKPGIVLIIEDTEKDKIYLKRLRIVAEKLGIKIWAIKIKDI